MAWISLLIIILGVGLDQIIKQWAIIALPAGKESVIVPNFLALTRLNNHGAAYNILSGQRGVFLVITVIALAILIYLFFKFKNRSHWLTISIAFLLAGTIGNACDRLFRGYVVDMIYLNVFNLPFLSFVCNIADILITIGVILLLIYVFKTDE
ncbi:signal peptidase II [Bombilactobacillus bombi]|uniref:Lipoprotein signal peptidase n=1 Tax=Bombilactobacillus bombi TaxID=1303590 RepID=A0A3R6ZUR9_9LACO|nr:signal peptidase II [Bombilactobacillus bombi]RHW45964.1 signal peptidase II [Bombilactobacillus bombi]RHW49860.1 signal peptidase II [Bombilactobacillus bombi]